MRYKVDNKKVGANIKKYRQYKNISLSDLSEKIGITHEALNNIEYGVRGGSISTLASISQALNIPIDNLIFGGTKDNNNKISDELLVLLNSLSEMDIDHAEEIIKNYILALDNYK